jgi:hypothetical protein
MRSALLITGNIRTFELCVESFNKICDKFNPDIFICVSDVEFGLHEFIRGKYNFERDSSLSLEHVKHKFKISSAINDKIKSILLVNKTEEDAYIQASYLHKFDTRKGWQGMDIFKQYHKRKICVEEAMKYEIKNNIKYDYVLHMRFDINIDTNTLPTYPLNERTLYVNGKDDLCFCCDSVDILKLIYEQVLDLFINNTDDLNICKNIHTMLEYSYRVKNINIVSYSINSVINREYQQLFDTNITLVTAFYDIGRQYWSICQRDNSKYFENCVNVFKLKNPIVVFTTQEYRSQIEELRKKTDPYMRYTKIIIQPFESLNYYENRDLIREIQNKNYSDARLEPEYTKPEYVILICNKINFMKQVTDIDPYNSQFFQWIDFGLHSNVITNECTCDIFSRIVFKPGKFRIAGFYPVEHINERNKHYTLHRSTLACGLMGGDKKSIQQIYTLFNIEFNMVLTEYIINQEQYIFYYLIGLQPDLFDYHCTYRLTYDLIGQTYLGSNNMKIALCMSGHMRSYPNCRQNIIENIINPLKNSGFSVYLFLSSWDDEGYGSDSLCSGKVNIQNYNLSEFTQYEFEPVNKQYFYNNFFTNKYLKYNQYSGPDTCPNAVQMLYKISRVYEMADNYSVKNNIKYDIVFRLRPDVIYNNKLYVHDIKQCLYDKSIFMPYHHGKYEIVTKYIMDQFFFGCEQTMREIMLIYSNIKILLEEDCPHTGEGFIWKQLMMKDINVNLINTKYSLVRKNNVIEPLI